MSRCKICDYAPGMWSMTEYYEEDGAEPSNYLLEHNGETLCAKCFNSIQDTLSEFDNEEDEGEQ